METICKKVRLSTTLTLEDIQTILLKKTLPFSPSFSRKNISDIELQPKVLYFGIDSVLGKLLGKIYKEDGKTRFFVYIPKNLDSYTLVFVLMEIRYSMNCLLGKPLNTS